MNLVNQSYEILGTPKSVKEAWEYAARAARTCYQSTKTKQDESEEEFCKRVLLKGIEPSNPKEDKERLHGSPLEFGTIYLRVPSKKKEIVTKYMLNKFSRYAFEPSLTGDDYFCITTNLRVLFENDWMKDLKYAGPPTQRHIKTTCFRLITCLHVYKDLTRHDLSWAIESTRFCNYIKEKFGVSITFVNMPWVKEEDKEEVEKDLKTIEDIYFKWINKGWQAQQAAEFLPQAVKAEVMMSGYEDDLQHVFNMRAEEISGPVHPLVAEIMKPMYEEWLTLRT